MRGSSNSTTTRPNPSNRSANALAHTATTGAASPSTNSTRAAGTAGSIGTYAAPVLSTAKIDTTASTERENSNATRSPGPTPKPTNKCANRFDASSSSRYVTDRPAKLTATASGARATCAANNTGIDTPKPTAWVNTPRFDHPSNNACSTSSNKSIDDNRRTGSAAIPTKIWCSRSISVWTLDASNTSVSNSRRKPNSVPGSTCTARG